MTIDRKYIFTAVNPCNGHFYTQENALVLTAKDAAVLPALRTYRRVCEEIGCSATHLESLDLLIERIRAFQEQEYRIPDTDLPCEVDRCIGGKI